MGSTYIIGQKSVLNSKYIILLVSLALTGIVMKLLSPPGKLDSTFFYNYEYAVSFLGQLSPEQSAKYFYAELFDYWYMLNYSLLLFFLFQKMNLFPNHRWTVFLTGGFDFLENTLIIYFLKTSHLSPLHSALPTLSAIKWLTGFFFLALLLVKFLARFRKS